jgi:hypothetical protein
MFHDDKLVFLYERLETTSPSPRALVLFLYVAIRKTSYCDP